MALIITAVAGPALGQSGIPPDCRVVRHHADGSTTVTPARESALKAQGGSARVESHAAGAHATSHLSASSRSGVGGHSASSSATQSSDGLGRTITQTRDDNGCTITIDDRRGPGENR
ncbi:MAG: hypothetical protein Q8K11_01490 [Phenylobacterium sp.]|uniref:hypothetical protein n=1 Tax=Phenylobacterium sp. TaxID=1871053 RepID=UPI00273208C5|nr:hypothetical protein [Phenylobacterium sp.]MDP2008825.1 hypothetical protein [Phenylobacterium sp.]